MASRHSLKFPSALTNASTGLRFHLRGFTITQCFTFLLALIIRIHQIRDTGFAIFIEPMPQTHFPNSKSAEKQLFADLNSAITNFQMVDIGRTPSRFLPVVPLRLDGLFWDDVDKAVN